MEQVDDFYFSALADAESLFPIADDKYAEQLQLQEVLLSSAAAAFQRYGLPTRSTNSGHSQTARSSAPRIKIERGESSSINAVKSETIFCKICMEAAPLSVMFANANCSHSFCRDCLARYISTKIKENISAVKCPEEDCMGMLEPEQCQELIPREVLDRWGAALCEAMVLASDKFCYCPFQDCSVMLLPDEGMGGLVVQYECPSCRRMFCMKCKVGWHSGLSCEELQSLGGDERGKEDLEMVKVAKSKKWKRCPQCKYYVEKTQGCLHVTCRCRYEFCYGCGEKWGDTHESSPNA